MAVIYSGTHVDEKYIPLVEPNLYADSIMIDGVTFTSQYEEGPAGGIFVRKLNTSASTVGTPGRDFTDETAGDNLIPIVFNNNFQKSKKIYGVVAENVEADLADEHLSVAVEETKEGANYSACACLVHEGTDYGATTAITKSNAKEIILKARKKVRDAKGKADVVLCSTAFYATILEAAGAEMTPVKNDAVAVSGEVGMWLGMMFVEANELLETAAKYYDYAGVLQTVDMSKVDFAMYNHKAFTMIPNFSGLRIVDSENFMGSKAQVESNFAYRVTSAPQVVIKQHA